MKTSFIHQAVTTEESIQLLETYRRTGAQAERTLNADPKLWDVIVQLHEQRYLKPTPRSMINRIWR
ncbi:hypothetical protein C9426_33285 [Serratia sp. S1B]|nr:hypothetical protein C9426_33285 [Serratia sp. S1B]